MHEHASPGNHHGHLHAAVCGGLDHHSGNYTDQQQRDLDAVLAFNRRMAAAIDGSVDVSQTERFLDPDPLRYMWVDEGQGQIGRVLTAAQDVLDRAPRLAGHERREVAVVPDSQHAARPSVAVGPDGSRLVVWVEWLPGKGDLVMAVIDRPGHPGTAGAVSGGVTDVFRPSALIDSTGVPWVFYGATVDGGVGVWAVSYGDSGWTLPELVSDTPTPSFNQEAVAHRDGSLELVWQGPLDNRFGIFSRRHGPDGWQRTGLVTEGVDANVWDPAVVAFDDGRSAYAWSEYRGGSYRVVLRERENDGRWGEPRQLTKGGDYALHPHLAVTADQQLWCAFDVITVSGHGSSGPTRLRPAAEVAGHHRDPEGQRAPGKSVPPEMLPEVTASIRVVNVADDGLRQPPGDLAGTHDVVPSGMPKLVATPDGGLVVAYRIHRRLPLMTYYWEMATQALGPDGWEAASTYRGTDGTLEEVSAAPSDDGALLVAQADARLERALRWTEGFGGRECHYLLEHHGAVIWHGIHGVGTVVTAELTSAGPVPSAWSLAERAPVDAALTMDGRAEARRWVGADGEQDRPTVRVRGTDYTLYWGDLHRHSLVSRCTAGDEPSLDDFYRYAWDVCEYDFWAVTDHSENSSDYQWWSIQKIADLFHVPDRFVPLYGFEWTSADTGHQNVIFGDVDRGAPTFSAVAAGTTDPAGLWRELAKSPEYPAITIPHHPGAAMVHNDWDFHDPTYSRLVEVFQACRGNYESEKCFRQYSDATRKGTFTLDGLLRGHRFGLIASSDHGHGASYVGAFAESLDRGAVFDALYQRRTFAATTRDVVISMRMGDVFMGEEAPTGAPRDFIVDASGYTDVARIDLLRDGELVAVLLPDLDLPADWVTVPLRVEWGGSDETTSWDGRLSVSGGGRVVQTDYWSPEVVAGEESGVRWEATTRSFGEPYGAQRGCVELTVVGPPGAGVTVQTADRRGEFSLAELWADPDRELPGGRGHMHLQSGTGGLVSLGSREARLEWTDPEPGPAFYYARVFLVDGEMAWASPIWVD